MAGSTGFAVWRAKRFAAEHPAPVVVVAAHADSTTATDADSSAKADAAAMHDSTVAAGAPTTAARPVLADVNAAVVGPSVAGVDGANGKPPALPATKGMAGEQAAETRAATDKASVATATLPSGLVGARLGKIFASMPAKEAAKVLGKMEDADITAILGRLNDRKASEILSLLPTERAAAISRAVLARGATGGHQ